VKSTDPFGYQRIQKVIDRLLIEPKQADGKMTGLTNGRFKKYVGRRDYRIIYYWCQLCRKENRRLNKNCDDCPRIPNNSVIFFDLYHKKDQKKIKRASNGMKALPIFLYSGGSILYECVISALREAMAPQYFFSDNSMACSTPFGLISVPYTK
jgi:hypothetical protein